MRVTGWASIVALLLTACATAGEAEWTPSNPSGVCDVEEMTITGYYLVNIDIADHDCDPPRYPLWGEGMVVVGAHGHPHGSQYYLWLQSNVWLEEAYDDVWIDVNYTFTVQSHESAPSNEPLTSMRGSFCGDELSAVFTAEYPPASEDWDGLNNGCSASWLVTGYLKWLGELDAGPE